jgi:ATP-binding protein involved in chromosome partitioning
MLSGKDVHMKNMLSNESVLHALSHVEEPDLKKDLVSLGMIRNLEVEGNTIRFTVRLTTPACPLKEVIRERCMKALETHLGPGLDVHIAMDAEVTSQREIAGPLLPGVKNIVAIASGKGGVGKSTVTSNLALALAKNGAKVGLIDADISGPSIPTMFGVEDAQPKVVVIDGKNYLVPVERLGIKLLSIGFLAHGDTAVVWRGPMMSSALKQFIADCQWGELDYLLIDLPPGTSDIHLTLVQTVPLTGVVVVTTPQRVALADAAKAISMFGQTPIKVPILGIVENMAYFSPPELPDNRYYIFGRDGGKNMAEKYALPFLGELPLVQSIREAGDGGVPIVMHDDEPVSRAFADLASNVARQVAIRNSGIQVHTDNLVAIQ